jgi:hypothetical protein
MIKARTVTAAVAVIASFIAVASVADAKGGGGGSSGGKGSSSGNSTSGGGYKNSPLRFYSPAPVCVRWNKQHCVAWN